LEQAIRDEKAGAKESGSEFRYELLDRIGLVAEAFVELPIAAALMAGEVHKLVQ